MKGEIIICSAVKIGNEIFRGNRHNDCLLLAGTKYGDKWFTMKIDAKQGFITSTGRFVEREEAKMIHEASGIKPFRGTYEDEKRLFSEDLY